MGLRYGVVAVRLGAKLEGVEFFLGRMPGMNLELLAGIYFPVDTFSQILCGILLSLGLYLAWKDFRWK